MLRNHCRWSRMRQLTSNSNTYPSLQSNGSTPIYFSTLIKAYVTPRLLCLSGQCCLAVPTPWRQSRLLSKIVPRWWNEPPELGTLCLFSGKLLKIPSYSESNLKKFVQHVPFKVEVHSDVSHTNTHRKVLWVSVLLLWWSGEGCGHRRSISIQQIL